MNKTHQQYPNQIEFNMTARPSAEEIAREVYWLEHNTNQPKGLRRIIAYKIKTARVEHTYFPSGRMTTNMSCRCSRCESRCYIKDKYCRMCGAQFVRGGKPFYES